MDTLGLKKDFAKTNANLKRSFSKLRFKLIKGNRALITYKGWGKRFFLRLYWALFFDIRK
jgi:hypothetical protein